MRANSPFQTWLPTSPFQILSQMTPQTITEIDALLGNKPHSKKESRAWRCKWKWQMMLQQQIKEMTGKCHFFSSAVYSKLHVPSNIMLPVCAHTHFARYIASHMKKKKKTVKNARHKLLNNKYFCTVGWESWVSDKHKPGWVSANSAAISADWLFQGFQVKKKPHSCAQEQL